MPLTVEPPAPAGPPEPAAATSDGGSMRPLVIFLVTAAVALVGTIVFALAHAGNEREQEQLAGARADVVHAVDDGRTLQEDLAQQVAEAEQVLQDTQGKVADDAVRADLAEHVTAAKELGAAQPPSVPEPGTADDTREDLDALRTSTAEWAETLRNTSATLATATEDVRTSNRQWQQERKDARAEARAAAEKEKRTAAQLETAKKTLTSVTAQLEISVRDSEYTLSWTADTGAPAGVRDTLATHRAEGQAALAAGADLTTLSSVQELGERREAARAAIEAAAWDARATVADGSNGRLDLDSLCKVGVGPEGQDQYLRCDAAEAWKKLGTEFEAEFGKPLRVEYGYRPYDWQLQALDEFGGGQVAAPGTSNHGWALAIDVPTDDGFRFGRPEFEWLAANGPRAGWHHPEWARAGGGREEPWHFEYEE